MKPIRLCLVRHGETDWNAVRRVQGQTDIPLNAAGRAQAEAAASWLAEERFDAIYSSDLLRAWHTALPIAAALGLPLHVEADLRERHYGALQGLTADEVRAQRPDLHAAHARRDPRHDFESGESLVVFAARIDGALRSLARRHEGQRVVLVTHGGVLDVVYRFATGRSLESPRDFGIPNAGFNWLEFRGEAWHVLAWGERKHLDAALDELGA